MNPFPLPAVLAHLHGLLETHTDERERGFFLAEQSQNHQAQTQPILIFVTAQELDGEKSDERRPPSWIGEVIAEGEPDPEAWKRYGASGVREMWRVRAPERVIEVWHEPTAEGYARKTEYRGQEVVVSEVWKDLTLVPDTVWGS